MRTLIWTRLSLSPKLELCLFAKVVRTESRGQSLWRESKTPERDSLFKSEAVASKFARGVTLVLGSRKSEEVKTSLVFQTP